MTTQHTSEIYPTPSGYGLAYTPDINGTTATDLDVNIATDGRHIEIPLSELSNALSHHTEGPNNNARLLLYPEEVPTNSLLDEDYGLSYAPSESSNLAYDIDIPLHRSGRRIEIPLQQLTSLLLNKIQTTDAAILLVYPSPAHVAETSTDLSAQVIRFAGNIGMIDKSAHVITLNGKAVHLALKEFAILSLLAQSLDRPLSAKDLQDSIWGDQYRHPTNLTIRIRWIRDKLEAAQPGMGHAKSGTLITIHGIGYKLLKTWPPDDTVK